MSDLYGAISPFVVWAFSEPLGMFMLLSYLLPTFVALLRRHAARLPIIVINLFLGWTLLGWVGAMAWSVSPFNKQPTSDVDPYTGMRRE